MLREPVLRGLRGVYSGKRTRQVPKNNPIAPFFEPFTAMILHRDLGRFCQGLLDGDAHFPGFNDNLKIKITVAPVLDAIRPNTLTPSFKDFFSKKTQETLVAPFKANLHDCKTVEITGHVDSALAAAVRQGLAREKYSNPTAVLAEFSVAKEDETRLLRERKIDEATMVWMDAAVDIDKMHESSSWSHLIRRGGEDFVSQLAPLYFLIRLNITHVQLSKMQESPYFSEMLAEDALKSAVRSLTKDFWMSGYKYIPSTQHMAKLRFRYATFYKIQGYSEDANRALTYTQLLISKLSKS
jgi:hypothetical protein